MKLKTLYKQTKTGAIQQYDVESIDGTYVVTQGQVGGKKQDYTTICEPKNVGKKNETSAEAQAKAEALSKHAKKIKAGYTLDPSGAISVKLPMRVKKYLDHKKKIIFPCYESPKLNGVNGTYRLDGDVLELTSRGGEQFPLIKQQTDEVIAMMKSYNLDELNGELYIPGEALQDISGAVKVYKPLSDRLEFHVFDLPGKTGLPYKHRLEAMLSMKYSKFVKFVPSYICNSHEELAESHAEYVKDGYEGLVVRNATGLYKHNEQSNDVFKFKIALDAEFYVEGHSLDKYGHAVFRCAVDHETNFKVKLKGTAEERLAMAAIATSYHGEWLKVEYEVLSNDGIPLKPVGIMFRECNANGDPLE